VPPFKPAQLAGSWKGTWHSVTFGSKGAAFIRAKAIGAGDKAKLNRPSTCRTAATPSARSR
jgi:hypothetical protein